MSSIHGLPPAPGQPSPAPTPVFVSPPAAPAPVEPLIEIYDLESEPELDLNGYKALCQRNSRRGLERLMRIIADDDQPASAHVSAIKELNDRSFGKSKQTVEVNIPDELADLNDEELEHFVRTRGERPQR